MCTVCPCLLCLCTVYVQCVCEWDVAVWVTLACLYVCTPVAVSLSLCVCLALCVPMCVTAPVPAHYLQSSPPVLTTNLSSCEKRMLVTCAECPKYRLCLACGTGHQLRDGTRQSSVPTAILTPSPFCSLGAAHGWTVLFGCCKSFLKMDHAGWVL